MVEHSDVGENEGKQAQLIAAETFTNVLKGDADGYVKSVTVYSLSILVTPIGMNVM